MHKQMASAAVLADGHKDTLAAALAAGTHLTKVAPEAAVTKAVEAAILRTPDADFTAARDTVETRIKGFTEGGLELPEELLLRMIYGWRGSTKMPRLRRWGSTLHAAVRFFRSA